jgi:hypothetical protein
MDNTNTGASESTALKRQPIGDQGRIMLVRPDGSGTYTARANVGDCYWRVASDVLKSRSGRTPSDTQVANFVTVLAAYNRKADANILAVGEDIEIPPPTDPPPQTLQSMALAPMDAGKINDEALEEPDCSEYTSYFDL